MNTNRKEINLKAALFPIVILVGLLSYNVFVYKDSALDGSNQFILLISAAVAALLGGYYGNSYKDMLEGVADNVKSTTTAFLILLMVGALSGTWLISGIIPAMIYYGIQILNPTQTPTLKARLFRTLEHFLKILGQIWEIQVIT